MPSASKAIAAHFKKNKQVILDEWELQVRAELTNSNKHDEVALRDAIPLFLDQLFKELSEGEFKSTSKSESKLQLAEEHGKQRAKIGNYAVDDVIIEYEILRRVLTAILEVREPVLNENREAIVRAICVAVRKAVAEFTAVQKDLTSSSEIALRDQLLALNQEREIRENFVSMLSHDLRTPLTAARMGAQVLLRQRDNPGSLEKLAGRIIDNLDRMDDMIRNLLDANRIKAGEKLPLEISGCELNRIIRETLDDLTTLYGNRFTFEENQEITGYWDASAVRRIIENLCGNAVKYGSADRITVELRLLSGEVEIEISVHNWGVPIPAVELENLFQHFRRGKREETKRHLGWGIGLTLVRGIAEAHGGRALVESSNEHGTTFKVKLPRDARNLMKSS